MTRPTPIHPLSRAQQQRWLLEQLGPGNPAHHIAMALRLAGPLKAEVLEQSLNEVAHRHESLRATFEVVDGQPVQTIRLPQAMRLPLIDLRHLPEGEREAEMERRLKAEARQPFDLSNGPLLRAILLRSQADEHVLWLTLHHIISDGWSMVGLARELVALYKAYANQPLAYRAELFDARAIAGFGGEFKNLLRGVVDDSPPLDLSAAAGQRTSSAYVSESPASAAIVGVQTAVPAFIGYTEKAKINGKPVFLQPINVASLEAYEAVFGQGCKPEYQIVSVAQSASTSADFQVYDPDAGTWNTYKLVQTPASQFSLYNSLRLFYANGGGPAVVVSVGAYEKSPTVEKDKLLAGLDATQAQAGPTMLVIPDAVWLDGSTEFQEVISRMLMQCGGLADRVAILDVYGAQAVSDQTSLDVVIQQFRESVGDFYLSYGMAYFPFVEAPVVESADIDYTNFALQDPATLKTLRQVLSWENQNVNRAGETYDRVQAAINMIGPDNPPQEVTALNQSLAAALPLLAQMEQVIVAKTNVLPPSGAMAGIYTYVDSTRGVWNAPANISLTAVTGLTYKLDDQQQGDLNLPIDGKAVNALRMFVGRGNVVWGGRTLDGNSNDWRYIQVRRTIIYIEQSIKNALNQFVFAPNDGNTWVTVTAMVSNFLQGVWSQGGLMGATASEAFSVQCGLGSTMTPLDILNGYMIVQVTLQMIRPAEFIELTFKQKMEIEGSSQER
jgi:uncharacterized protein